MRMHTDIKFDREIVPGKHYISPGSYEMRIGGQNVQFDFEDYEGHVDKEDRTVLHCDMRGLDLDSFPESGVLERMDGPVEKINEFFVYTGEDGEPEIFPLKLLSLELQRGDGEDIPVLDSALGYVFQI